MHAAETLLTYSYYWLKLRVEAWGKKIHKLLLRHLEDIFHHIKGSMKDGDTRTH